MVNPFKECAFIFLLAFHLVEVSWHAIYGSVATKTKKAPVEVGYVD